MSIWGCLFGQTTDGTPNRLLTHPSPRASLLLLPLGTEPKNKFTRMCRSSMSIATLLFLLGIYMCVGIHWRQPMRHGRTNHATCGRMGIMEWYSNLIYNRRGTRDDEHRWVNPSETEPNSILRVFEVTLWRFSWDFMSKLCPWTMKGFMGFKRFISMKRRWVVKIYVDLWGPKFLPQVGTPSTQ